MPLALPDRIAAQPLARLKETLGKGRGGGKQGGEGSERQTRIHRLRGLQDEISRRTNSDPVAATRGYQSTVEKVLLGRVSIRGSYKLV